MSDKKLILCPYCGNTQTEPEDRCAACGGFFDPLSLKVTQQHMGPWFVRDRNNPFRPGCTYEVLVKQIEKGKIKPTTIIRGPTTRQFWSVARHVPGVANLLGYCHHCGTHVEPSAESCSNCGEVFFQPRMRDNLGLAPAGTDVHIQPKLSDSGAFEAIDESPTIDKPMQLPKPAAAQAPAATGEADDVEDIGIASTIASFSQSHAQRQMSDQPVGSSILAGLRTSQSAELPPPVSSATAQASASRDAMAWMTGSDQSELDSLATAAAEYTPPARTGMNWATWVLIAVNLALLAAGAAVVFIAISRNQPAAANNGIGTSTPTTTSTATVNNNDLSANLPERHIRPPKPPNTTTNPDTTNQSRVKLPDVPESPTPDTHTGPLPTNPRPNNSADTTTGKRPNIFSNGNDERPLTPVEQERRNWAARFKEGQDAENRGDPDKALGIYKDIKIHADESVQPRGLDRAIERVESMIKRRNVEKVLGK